MKYWEIKKFVMDHKMEIALGALGMVGTGVLVALGVKGIRSIKNVGNPMEMIGDIIDDSWTIDDSWQDKNVVKGFTTGKVNELWNESGYGNAIVQFFKIKDMGDLGEDLKKIGGITDETEVSAVLSFIDTKVKVEP